MVVRTSNIIPEMREGTSCNCSIKDKVFVLSRLSSFIISLQLSSGVMFVNQQQPLRLIVVESLNRHYVQIATQITVMH